MFGSQLLTAVEMSKMSEYDLPVNSDWSSLIMKLLFLNVFWFRASVLMAEVVKDHIEIFVPEKVVDEAASSIVHVHKTITKATDDRKERNTCEMVVLLVSCDCIRVAGP